MLKVTRRALFKLLGGSSAVALLGCHGSSTPPPTPDGPPASCSTGMAATMIANNHVHAPHALVVPAADIQAGVDKTYDIMGAATHTHQVTVTAAQFAMLQAGGTVMSTSTETLAHTHVCTISCA